ncbi:hypothetical protein LIS04_142 [Listeria phage LIS04]|nr:hypothetical protein LIS04_142 [Listeria phage LIS04]
MLSMKTVLNKEQLLNNMMNEVQEELSKKGLTLDDLIAEPKVQVVDTARSALKILLCEGQVILTHDIEISKLRLILGRLNIQYTSVEHDNSSTTKFILDEEVESLI